MRSLLPFALLVAVRGYAGELPEALQRAHEGRLLAETGLVEWSKTDAAGDRHSEAAIRFYSTRVAGDTVSQSIIGDEEGIVLRLEDGSVGPNGRRAYRTVHVDGQIWSLQEGLFQADACSDTGRRKPPPDFRTFGICAQPSASSIHDEKWIGQLGGARFREWTEGALRVVRADLPNGAGLQWWVDPEKGWSIVRATQLGADGIQTYESRCLLSEFDGVWLPSEVTYFRRGFQEGKLPYRTIRIHKAEVNRPEQPGRLGPADIGVEPGMMVAVRDAETPSGTEVRTWDGNSLVSRKEWQNRVGAGAATYGPSLQREFARQRAKAWKTDSDPRVDWGVPGTVAIRVDGLGGSESSWQRYTREFISKYELNDEQAQRAWSICRECEADRDTYLRQRHDDFAELEKRETVAKGTPSTASGEAQRLASRRHDLVEPARKIFDEKLKPRLDKLPTREQRTRAEGPTTRHAGNP